MSTNTNARRPRNPRPLKVLTPEQRIRQRWSHAAGRQTKGQFQDHATTAAPRYHEGSLLHVDHRGTRIWRDRV